MESSHMYAFSPAQPVGRAAVVARVVLGAAALALASRLTVPFWPVPVTAQTLAVLLLGVMLGPCEGVWSVTAFLAAGLAGLPVFVAGGGPLYILGPTGGYLLGFVAAAYLAGTFAQRGCPPRWRRWPWPMRSFSPAAWPGCCNSCPLGRPSPTAC
jgi:biotin transport system substrate-specific component